jgi:hypothetical protein
MPTKKFPNLFPNFWPQNQIFSPFFENN